MAKKASAVLEPETLPVEEPPPPPWQGVAAGVEPGDIVHWQLKGVPKAALVVGVNPDETLSLLVYHHGCGTSNHECVPAAHDPRSGDDDLWARNCGRWTRRPKDVARDELIADLSERIEALESLMK